MTMSVYQPISHRQRGVGLIEIMLAMVLGLLLTGGLINIFLANKQSYAFNQGLSRLQENSRFALEILARDLQKSDYRNGPTDGRFVKQGSDRFPNFIAGCESGATSCDLNGDGDGTNDLPADAFPLLVDTFGIAYEWGQDCLGNAVPTTGDKPDGVDRLVWNRYFVRQDANGVLQLYCLGNGGAPPQAQPLIDGIEDLQILYGEDSDNDKMADRYLPANDANLQMQRVVSIRLAMLVQTEDNVSPQPEPYTDLSGNTVNPSDRRLRREFSTTINLRNRVK